tara:strand:+ start:46283 stop:47737 length:1455 start_codon:yes stop_codon:yes gene_type:complete
MTPTPAEADRPNIIFITTDQQRFDTIAALGAGHLLTPHMDWLVDTGVTYTRAYADAPICVPARATMITGRQYLNMPEGCGYFGQPTTDRPRETLPAILTEHGYQTKSVGKLHYEPVRTNYGWEHTEILADYYWEMEKRGGCGVPMDHGLGQNEMQPAISTVDESDSLTRWIIDRSARFLETRDETRPFCLHVGFSKPHPPFDPCRNFWELYAGISQPDPVFGDWSQNVADIPPGFLYPTWNLNGADRLSPEVIRACRRAYAALITQIDYSLGILFARMRELNVMDNTVIVFCSDHGEMLGDHHMGAKTVYLEGSAHVPMIMRLPDSLSEHRRLRGHRCDSLATHADIMPTLLNLAGVPGDRHPPMDGIDLLAMAQGKVDRDQLIAGFNEFYAVIEKRYKYLTCTCGGELMFDLAHDPMERSECIRSGNYASEHKRLSTLLRHDIEGRNLPLPGSCEAKSRKETRSHFAQPGFQHRNYTRRDVLH